MRVVVLHSGADWLACALRHDHHSVVEVVPTVLADGCRRARPHAEIHAVDRWTDPTALGRLATVIGSADAVATSSEECVYTAAALREVFGGPGLSLADASACTDKAVAKGRLTTAGIPVARHRLVHRAHEVADAARELGWPVVVKPRRSAATMHTAKVDSPARLKLLIEDGFFDTAADDPSGRMQAAGYTRSLHELPDGFLVEEFIVGVEYFIDLHRHAGQTLLACPGRYAEPLLASLGHHSWAALLPADSPEAIQLTALAVRVADALGLESGPMHMEAFRTAGGWVVGEAAARPGGGGIRQICELQHGVDLTRAVAAGVVGRRPDIAPAARHPVATAMVLVPPPGRVAAIALADEIMEQRGMLACDLRLRVGAPVPQPFGTLSPAGALYFASEGLEEVTADAKRIVAAVRLRVDTGRGELVEVAA